ncbi:MAG: hypothetical protein WC438_00575 [Candidatus Pacearchaeota archaeon]
MTPYEVYNSKGTLIGIVETKPIEIPKNRSYKRISKANVEESRRILRLGRNPPRKDYTNYKPTNNNHENNKSIDTGACGPDLDCDFIDGLRF